MTQSESPEGMKYNTGDTITIMRGIHRGKAAKVMGVDTGNRQYATTLTDGSFLVVNEVNTKPPAEGKIGASKLADLVGSWADSADATPATLAGLLSQNVDGFAEAYDKGSPTE